MSKPKNLKPDKDYMIECENYRFPCTDSKSMAKLLWDKKLQQK